MLLIGRPAMTAARIYYRPSDEEIIEQLRQELARGACEPFSDAMSFGEALGLRISSKAYNAARDNGLNHDCAQKISEAIERHIHQLAQIVWHQSTLS